MIRGIEKERKLRVQITPSLPGYLADEISRKIYYLSEGIIGFSLLEGNSGHIEALDLTIKENQDEESLTRCIHQVIATDIVGIRDTKPRRVWHRNFSIPPNSTALYEELSASELIYVHGEGQVSIREPLIVLFGFFDSILKTASQRLFNAEPYQFPTLLSEHVLRKAGYFEKFPQFLMFVGRMKNEGSNFDAFKKHQSTCFHEEHFEGLHKYTCSTGYNLPPTMCYYVYDMLKNTAFSECKAITAVGKSFRYENKYHHPLTRLWDFTIRETVFLGTSGYVESRIQEYRSTMCSLMERLGLSGLCETATDPFFLSNQTPSFINSQKLIGTKHELRLYVKGEETTAVASFNVHGQFLAKRFNLMDASGREGGLIFTGCVGIGLERLVFAFLAQCGTNPKRWPEIIQSFAKNSEMTINQLEAYLVETVNKNLQ